MTLEEKNEMRDNLSSFAVSYTPIVSPYHHFTLMMKRSLAVAFIAILSVGSLSSLASGDALPGDTLYPVKIAHEEIKLATTVNTKKKISYEIRRTEKRIQEATELATHNGLDSNKQVEIAKNIKKQTDKVQEHIKEVTIDNPEDALALNAELKSTIKVHAAALKKVSTKIEKKKKELKVTEEPVDITKEITISDENNTDLETTSEPIPTSEEVDTHDEYETIHVSSAESLLESIEEEVKDIEAFETEVSEALVKNENSTDLETTHSIEEKTDAEEIVDMEAIAGEIKSLEDILDLKEQIKKVKSTMSDVDKLNVIEEFNLIELNNSVDTLIQERKYKKAFLILQGILTNYQEAILTKELHLDLGIENQEAKNVGMSESKDLLIQNNDSNSIQELNPSS